jgi:hypothetical protein
VMLRLPLPGRRLPAHEHAHPEPTPAPFHHQRDATVEGDSRMQVDCLIP